ncbi:4'-phosphopantetheinyl transferase family protein [Streptomyces sp. NBC_01167]|uniref:4'-phosphopantetheinyl transferase family protein n=1 Tax=unclassified Streptomyces TaxID=2593676 RepID=UPI00386B029C|nr:4'-phosphopantetheinyl transferase superfamily protein [Streptomyces sp. NBC_01167]
MADTTTVAERTPDTGTATGTGATYLWLLPEHAVTTFAAGLGGDRLLTEEERARGARLVTPAARQRFLGRRLLSRYALSDRTGRPLDSWRFTTGRYGRPETEPDTDGVRFSLSHTEGLIVCAVTHGRSCGVDVEGTTASAESAHYISRFFAADELLELAALDPADLVARVGDLWVLKEAYLKAQGTGLHRSLAGFSFASRGPAAGRRITVHDTEQTGPSAGWSFELLRPTSRHLLALAIEGAHPGALHQTWLTST